MNLALYEVTVGDKETECDNASKVRVMAEDALKAIKQIRLGKSEYIAEVRLIGRSDK